jgi:hypothetical protein
VGHRGRCGRVRKISPPTGIRSPDRPTRRSRYTDLAIPAYIQNYRILKYVVDCFGLDFGKPVLHATDSYGEPTEKINNGAKTSADMQALSFRNRPQSTVTHTQEF